MWFELHAEPGLRACSGCDAVFRGQKFLQRPGQHGGQFLPGQQLQVAAQNAAPDPA